jgi:hypothetical protein
MWTPRTLAFGLGLALFVAASWALRFAGHGTFPALDVLLYFLPLYEATYARVAAGTLPLWNPYQLCGEPWIATLQAGVFYPPHLLYLLLPLASAYAASGVLHLVVAALSTAAFCRRAGLGAAAAMLAAVLFALRGRMAYSLIQPNFLEAVTWLPLGALAVLRIASGEHRIGAGLLALATALSLLAGYPQPTIYMAYAWSLLLVALLVGNRAAGRSWLGAAVAFVGGGMLGGLAAAVQLLPAAELTRIGVRATQELDAGTIAQMGFITPAPVILGTGAIAGDAHAYGVIALALVVVALLADRRRALALWAVGLAVLSALLALAGWGPLYRLYLALPLISWFRYPHRLLVLTDFAIAIAAALGLDTLLRVQGARRWVAAGAGLAGLIAVVVLASLGATPRPALPVVYAVAGVGLVLLLLLLRGGRARRGLVVALALLAAIEVARSGWHGVRLPYADESSQYRTFEPGYRELAARAGADRVCSSVPDSCRRSP